MEGKNFDLPFTNSKGEKLFLGDIYYLKRKVVSVTFSYPRVTRKKYEQNILGLDTGVKIVQKTITEVSGIEIIFAPMVEFVIFRFSNQKDYEDLKSSEEKELYKLVFSENSKNRFLIRIPISSLKSIEWI